MNEVVKQGDIKVSRVCERVGMSRQNYYALRRERQARQIDEELVVELVKAERRLQPRIGGRKLLVMLRPRLAEAGVSIGRDRLFEILKKRELLVKRKAKRPRTTHSRHSLPVFGNLLKEVEPTGPHQVWVSDLSYLRTEEGFVYAFLITDLYSRKIVGYHLGDSLGTEGAQKALEKALEQLPEGCFPIHHSDRGSQYCCHEYVERLRRRGLRISMTEERHCYENAVAERVNGILKQEYELDATYRSKRQAKRAFRQAVEMYNCRRPHMSLEYAVPSQVHAGVGWRARLDPRGGASAVPGRLRAYGAPPPWDTRNISEVRRPKCQTETRT